MLKLKYLLLLIVHLVLFLSSFYLLQNETIYKKTMGKISMNYERTGDWENYRIEQVRKPYIEITNENLQHWDADIYRCIKEKMYSNEEGCYQHVVGAFFPLFPALWKILGTSTIGICLVNYLLFSIGLLVFIETICQKENESQKLLILMIGISLPSSIFFYLPYTESLFLLTAAIAVVGFYKKNYLLYFVGSFLVATCRPASIFIGFSILLLELLLFLGHRNFIKFTKSIFIKIIPFVLGYFSVLCFQFYYRNSWSVLMEARKFWPEESLGMRLPTALNDWSLEGFGMSVFAIFFICLPAIFYLLKKTWQTLFSNKPAIGSGLHPTNEDYLFLISLIYMGLFLMYTLLYRGGSFNSFSRYILGSPFLLLLIILLSKKYFSQDLNLSKRILTFASSCLLLIIFLSIVAFGGGRLRFEYAGMHIFILLAFYLYFHTYLKKNMTHITLMGIYFFNLLWSTYLLNCFLCNGWIFT